MGDEPEVSPSGNEVSPLVPSGVEEKPKRRSPKPQGLPTTEAGEKVADQLKRKLVEMVDAAALTEANRRRATAIDTTDCEAGFDRIAGPKKQETAIAIIADVANTIGSGLIGYSINIYTGSRQDFLGGHLAMVGGVALGLTSIILKYVIRAK